MKLLVLLFAFLNPAADVENFFQRADAFLSTYVKDGNVAYKQIHDNPAEIAWLYDKIGSMDVSSLNPQEQKAFYINAYNLIVIYQVSTYYPLKSPMDASGFFDKVSHKVAGEGLTLNALEYKKLLLVHNDARIHFVLACAAKSCPPLASFAFLPARLEQQLDERTIKSINDSGWLKVDARQKTVSISKIFQWYEKDFTRDGGTVLGFINTYRKSEIPSSYAVKYYEYNWQLNE